MLLVVGGQWKTHFMTTEITENISQRDLETLEEKKDLLSKDVQKRIQILHLILKQIVKY